MGTLQLNSYGALASFSVSHDLKGGRHHQRTFKQRNKFSLSFYPGKKKIRAVGTIPETTEPETTTTSAAASEEEPPAVKFAFVSPVLLPDGTPDVHYRTACGGQKLRDIMLDSNIDLYGPYSRPLLNCGGGGTCATCMVEVVGGKELLTPRTEKEKEKLRKHPKNWRMACQTTVGKADSRGLVVIQQLPEWKGHEWNYGKEPPEEEVVYV